MQINFLISWRHLSNDYFTIFWNISHVFTEILYLKSRADPLTDFDKFASLKEITRVS